MSLRNLTATIEAGKVIGIAGTTGAGKSTLVKLLLRLYEPSDGHIYLGDQEIRDIPLRIFDEGHRPRKPGSVSLPWNDLRKYCLRST